MMFDDLQAVKFHSCNASSLTNITFINSSQAHILIARSHYFHVDNLLIEAPEDSPNTDGIHIHASEHIAITNTIIRTGYFFAFNFDIPLIILFDGPRILLITPDYLSMNLWSQGDDCVSIGDRTSHIHISSLICGPGHGVRSLKSSLSE